jgi:hypothetical protein
MERSGKERVGTSRQKEKVLPAGGHEERERTGCGRAAEARIILGIGGRRLREELDERAERTGLLTRSRQAIRLLGRSGGIGTIFHGTRN